MKYILMLALTILMSGAFASPGNDGCVGNCAPKDNGAVTQGQEQSQGQAQGQAQGQGQAQAVNVGVDVKNTNNNANVNSVKNESNNANANLNSNKNENNNANANLNANKNNNNSNSNSISEGSNSKSASGAEANSNIVVDNTTNYPKPAASSAAGVFPQSCQEGASGQSYSGGAATVFESAMCQSLKMAEVHQRYWVMYSEMDMPEQAAMHKKLMDKYVAEAGDSADLLYYPKQIGSFFLSILPVGLLFLLL